MKKVFLLVLCSFAIIAMDAQEIIKKRSVSGGLLGAVNFTKFKAGGTNASNIDYNTETGWSGGLWVSFPLGTHFSFEPQVMFSSYSYQTDDTEPVLVRDGEISYISVPLQLKLHAGDKFAITAGPQFDFFASLEDDVNTGVEKEHIKQTSIALVGGFELFPQNRVSFFGRYMHGLTNMNAVNIHGTGTEFMNRNIQAGLKLKLFGKQTTERAYQAAPTPLPAPVDTDGDGITDDVDKCPNEKGTAKYNGCPIPDSDGDGINDELDKCPNEKGTAKYNGCPIPDSDGDGINDELDKCPTQAGPANRNGCPITDRDKDGISDEEDKCPDVAGTAKNNGCPDVPPEVTKMLSASAQNISFITSSAKLSTTANTSLNQVVKVLNENPTLKVKIEGHTDNVEKNAEALSESRANAVKTYLTSKGISADRIEVEGFGSTMPIADNNTAAGKTKNRRVEIKVSY
jgi:outer membrane protein OmpA-like peptidoglycan-associated protein